MLCAKVLQELKSYGSAQTRKTYARHGIVGPAFGVKYGDLNKLKRKIKVSHDLAFELWNSGNYDARILATMVFDPLRIRVKDLAKLLKDIDCHVLSTALSNIAQRSPVAEKVIRKWMSSRAELTSNAGWMMLAGITRERPEIFTKREYGEFLRVIELDIHRSPNRTKHAMNSALIGIGTYIDEKKAITCANRIGRVEVDYGDTSCKTRQAAPSILKAAAQHREKLEKLAATK